MADRRVLLWLAVMMRVAWTSAQTCDPVTESLVMAISPGDVGSQTYGRLDVRGITNLACNTTSHNFRVTGQMRAEKNVHVVGALIVDGNITVNGAFALPGVLTGLTIDDSVIGGSVPGAGTFTVLEATQKLGLYGVTPVAQPATTGSTAGFVHPGAGNITATDSCTTGGLGLSCYTNADIVLALKRIGALAV